MKKRYTKPYLVSERFVADEYVAACGESGTVYKFKCDAKGGYYYSDGDGDGDMELLNTGYHPCGATHEAGSDEVFKRGFIDYNYDGKEDEGESVMCWLIYDRRGRVTNGHATTELDMSKWETAKS